MVKLFKQLNKLKEEVASDTSKIAKSISKSVEKTLKDSIIKKVEVDVCTPEETASLPASNKPKLSI